MKSRHEREPDGGARSSEAIKTNIEHTREKMDQTLDQIGERLRPRHLLDEALDYLRSHGPSREGVKEKANVAMGKAGDSAGKAVRVITETVRQYPIPSLLIGAGVAYAFYERQQEDEGYYEIEEDELPYGFGTTVVTEEYVGPESGELKSSKEKVQEKLAGTGQQLKEKGENLKARAAEKGRVIRIKASEMRRRMAARARETYSDKREQVVRMSDEHPLSTGIGLLAAGLLVGLALPHTRPEDEFLGRTSDKLKRRAQAEGKDLVERGKNVASAAYAAAKETAEREGLTLEQMKHKAGEIVEQTKQKAAHVASETKSAAQHSMEEQGLTAEGAKSKMGQISEEVKSGVQQSMPEQQPTTNPGSAQPTSYPGKPS